MIRPNHIVTCYEHSRTLYNTVSVFIASGLKKGHPALLIATHEHRAALLMALGAVGGQFENALRLAQLVVLDAREMLRTFMVGPIPDSDRFKSNIEGAIRQIQVPNGQRMLFAFGEMVDVLGQEGNEEGAIRLEQLWNELAATHAFRLLCGYAIKDFEINRGHTHFRKVCSEHEQVWMEARRVNSLGWKRTKSDPITHDERPGVHIDSLFMPVLTSSDQIEASLRSGELISKEALPIIKRVLWRKLKLHLPTRTGNKSIEEQDAEDIRDEVYARLVESLNKLVEGPSDHPIENFRQYIDATARHACDEFLRQKRPNRARLKDTLSKILKHEPFALWPGSDGKLIVGFKSWQAHRDVVKAPITLQPDLLNKARPNADLISRVLDSIGGPMNFDELVTIVAESCGVIDPVVVDDGVCPPLKTTPIEDGLYLSILWSEICQLPPRQRTALLLNLGYDAVAFLPVLNIATIPEIATVLAMPTEELLQLWNGLPLDDESIANQLGATRQQIINLRKAARERLAHRMKKHER